MKYDIVLCPAISDPACPPGYLPVQGSPCTQLRLPHSTPYCGSPGALLGRTLGILQGQPLGASLGTIIAPFARTSAKTRHCCTSCHPQITGNPPQLWQLLPTPPPGGRGWVSGICQPVGGGSRASRGGRAGRGIKEGLFLSCKAITSALQVLICPGAIGSCPEPPKSSVQLLSRVACVKALHRPGSMCCQGPHACCPGRSPAPGDKLGRLLWARGPDQWLRPLADAPPDVGAQLVGSPSQLPPGRTQSQGGGRPLAG